MRKVFLDELPRKGKIIDWKSSVGYKVKFIYDEIKGELEIINHEACDMMLTLKYNGNLRKINTSGLKKASLGYVLGIMSKDFRYDVRTKFDNIEIIDREIRTRNRKDKRNENQKWYKYHCNKCGNEDWIEENNLKRRQGCNVCSNNKVLKGYNDIATTDHWMIDLGMSEEDAYKYTRHSNKQIKVICPYCKKEKNIIISNMYRRKSIGCSCGDGFSYPEKFISCLLNQLNIKYINQLSKNDFNWCGLLRYDFYLFDYNCIIETNGRQHYVETIFKTKRTRSLKSEQENDEYKRDLALNNGINKYIILDCSESNLEWIKNSVLNSELNDIFNLSKIDWMKCEEFALSNRAKEICDYWNKKDKWENTKDVANMFSISRTTVTKYLKQGTKLGWCNYDVEEEMRKRRIMASKAKCKPIRIFKDGVELFTIGSAQELEHISEELFGFKLFGSNVAEVCKGKKSQYKGFQFKYVEDGDNIASK